jgi:hypothetical protein
MVAKQYTVAQMSRILGVSRQRVHQIRRELSTGTRLGPIWTFSDADKRKMVGRAPRGRPRQNGSAAV